MMTTHSRNCSPVRNTVVTGNTATGLAGMQRKEILQKYTNLCACNCTPSQKMAVVGITGSAGKTTTSWLLRKEASTSTKLS